MSSTPLNSMSIFESLFNKSKSKKPDLTREQFAEKRQEALAKASPDGHTFTEVGGGVVMEGIPTPEERADIIENADVPKVNK